jgi:hypothetical protein
MSIHVRTGKVFNKICQLHELLNKLAIDEDLPSFNEVNIYQEPLPIDEVNNENEKLSTRSLTNKGVLNKIDENITTDTSSYHDKRDRIFFEIDSLYRDLTPAHGQLFFAKLCPHRTSKQILLMDEAYRKTTPHEGKRLLAKMCPPNV